MSIGSQHKKNNHIQHDIEKKKNQPNNVQLTAWWMSYVPPIVLSVLTALFYYPSLSYPFQFDDLANISKKFEIRFFDLSAHLFKYSRWVGEVLNRLNYQLGEYFRFGGGGFDPFYYRVVNVCLHISTGMLVYVVFKKLLQRLPQSFFLRSHALSIASVTSALFLLHPVQTQTVSYVIQARLEGMATFFILLVLLAMITAFESKTAVKKYLFQVLAIAIAFVSCGTKEIVIVLPFLTVLVDLFFFADGDYKKVLKNWLFHLTVGVVVLITLAKYINPDFFMKIVGMKASVSNNRGNILNNSYSQMITPFHFLISEFKVILHYIAIFFAPFKLSVEYDWKMVKNFFSFDCITPFIVLVGLGVLAIYRWIKNKESVYAFSLAWFFISIAPRSTIMPSPELVCDYKTYLASIGIFFWMAVMIVKLYELACTYDFFSENIFTRRMQTMAFSFICFFGLGFSAYSRNLVWETTVSFWLDIVEKAPEKARGQNNLGVALSESGRYEEATPYFMKAITLDKFYSDPWSNAAVVYSVKGDDDRAIHCLKEAVRLNPEYAEAHNNLGSMLIRKGDFVTAEVCLNNALAIRPHYGKAWFNKGRMYLDQKRNEEAWTAFVKATQGDLDIPNAFDILGQVGLQLCKYEQAVVAFEEAIKRSGGVAEPQTKFNLANALFLTNRLPQARELFKELSEQHPDEQRFAYNFAETMFMQGDYSQAYPVFSSIAQRSDVLPNASMRTAQCLEKMGQVKEAFEYVQTRMASTNAQPIINVLRPEHSRLELALHLKESGGMLTSKDLQHFLGKNSQDSVA